MFASKTLYCSISEISTITNLCSSQTYNMSANLQSLQKFADMCRINIFNQKKELPIQILKENFEKQLQIYSPMLLAQRARSGTRPRRWPRRSAPPPRPAGPSRPVREKGALSKKLDCVVVCLPFFSNACKRKNVFK